MRPGPGLVVMALAFISGARRGSTSSISSKTTTTSSSPPQPPTPQILTTTTPASSLTLFQTTATTSPSSTLFSSFISTTTTTTSTPPLPTTRGDTITTTSSPLPTQPINIYENFGFFGSQLFKKEQENDHQIHLSKRPKEPVPFNFFNTFFTRNSYNSYPSTSNYFVYTYPYPLPSHLAQHYDDPRIRTESKSVLHSAKHTRRANSKFRRRRKRRTRSANVKYRGSGTGSDDANENLNDSDDTLTSLTTAGDGSNSISSSDSVLSDQTTLARGLPVHFPSLTVADSSRSLDEDDIFALVAEDDLLSEESFDHLVKLTNDKIGDTNEEDYSSGTESVVESSSGSGSGAPDNVHDDIPDQQNAIEDFVLQQQQQNEAHDQQNQDHKQNSQIQDDEDDADTDGDDGGSNGNNKEKSNGDRDSEQDDVESAYTAHLVGNTNEKIVSLAEKDLIHSSDIVKDKKEDKLLAATIATTTTTTTTTATKPHPKVELDSPNRYQTILESNFALTRLNPWISACDLAQPGPLSAPDLQGECSAGPLPVARVDEGPGPPTCLKSCKEETPFTNKLNKDNMFKNKLINNNNSNNNNNNSKQNKNKNDNKLNKLVGYTKTTNTFNIKLRNSQPTISHSMNTNNNNDNDNSNSNKNNNNNMNIDDNNSNNNNNFLSNLKLLNPFNYYQIHNYNNNNNNKMTKIRRNSKETVAVATSQNQPDVASRTKTTNASLTQASEGNDSEILASMSGRSNEDYELLHDLLMQQDEEAATNKIKQQQELQQPHDHDHNSDHQTHHQFNDAAIAAAAIVMQLNQQQQQQSHNNNNIVKMKLMATNDNSNNQYELKYNHLKEDHVGNSNRRHQSNINNSPQHFDTSSPKTTSSHTAVGENHNNTISYNNNNSDQYLKIPTPPEKPQLQCLEYLGDSEATMPMHLCHLLTPSDRLAQLRHLRLRNCCERNVYSALHTLALNATLSGGTGCLRVLEDLMDLDALASRITCGLTEILFRFDCRQVYSIIHQCDDCKEAYRRWVCSTLVPYFAETSDVMKPPEILTTTTTTESISAVSHLHNSQINSFNSSRSNAGISNNNNTTTMASNMTTSHNAATTSRNGSKNDADMSTKSATSNFIANINSNNNNNNNNYEHDIQYNAYNYQQHFHGQQQLRQHHVNRRNIQNQQHFNINHKMINNSGNSGNSNNNNKSHENKINDIHYKTISIYHKNQPQQHQLRSSSSTTPALIFNDIINLKSRTTSLRTSQHHASINASNEPEFELKIHHKSTNKRRKRSDNSTTTTTANIAYVDDDVAADVNRPSMSDAPSLSSSSSSSSLSYSSSSASSATRPQMQRQQQQQSFNFISTANNEDSYYANKNPVITKLLKRSKRKEFEFRKRRRIRPCLSVCQTVEQKCPYLLPADRAPSMPTQYAGEPTFLCLDYNIAETEEQLRKASHGPNECCYTYCSNSADGICTYCDDMWDKTEIDKEVEVLSEERETKVFNITMTAKGHGNSAATIRVETKIQQKIGEEKNGVKMSTVAIAVRNDTAFENATRLAERLQYYAFCDGVFYYDDTPDDMPEYPQSENCRLLPPVQSRCNIPYYATNYMSSADMLGSYRKHNEAQKLLVWLSTLLCLWSCYSARSMRLRRLYEDKRHQQQQQILTHQQHLRKTNTAYKGGNMCQSCQTREIMQNKGNCVKIVKMWCDYNRKCRIIIIYCLEIEEGTRTPIADKRSLRDQRLLIRNFRHMLHSTSVKLNLKIFKIPSMILLINYKEILLLLFKKRQKLRKRKMKRSFYTKRTAEETWRERWKCWPNLRDLRFKNLKSKSKEISFNKQNKIHYYYYYYDYYYNYYCSCSQIFSCSCNKQNNIIINNYNYYYNNNDKYIKKFKNNFSTCNFNKNTKKYQQKIYENQYNNKLIMIKKINYKKVSIIKFNTTITTKSRRRTTTKTQTHIFIINSYNNDNIKNYYNNIIITIINNLKNSNNKNNNNNKKQIFNSFSSIPNPNSHHQYYNYYYYYKTNYNDYYKFIFKPKNKKNNNNNSIIIKHKTSKNNSNNNNKMINNNNNNNNNNVLLETFILPFSLTTSPWLSKLLMIVLMIIEIIEILTLMKMLIVLIMPLLFKSFLKMKYNNNHHMKQKTTTTKTKTTNIKSNPSLSPNISYNSKKTNYRYFYYYNFNINDWWQRRRWWPRRRLSSLNLEVDNKHHYTMESLLFNVSDRSSIRSQKNIFHHILL